MRFCDTARTFRQHIRHHAGNNPPHGFVNHPVGIQIGISRKHFAQCLPRQWNVAQINHIEKLGTQPVIDIMRIIGNVIGNCRHLRFGRGKG